MTDATTATMTDADAITRIADLPEAVRRHTFCGPIPAHRDRRGWFSHVPCVHDGRYAPAVILCPRAHGENLDNLAVRVRGVQEVAYLDLWEHGEPRYRCDFCGGPHFGAIVPATSADHDRESEWERRYVQARLSSYRDDMLRSLDAVLGSLDPPILQRLLDHYGVDRGALATQAYDAGHDDDALRRQIDYAISQDWL